MTHFLSTGSLQTNEKDEPSKGCRGHRDEPPRSPGKKDWWPQLLEVWVRGQPFKECLGCRYLAQSRPIQGAHIQPLPEASGAFQGLCKGTGQAMLQRSPWGWLKQLDPS